MNAKEAIEKAKAYVREILAEEKPQDIGLEEISHDSYAGRWDVTIGFTRRWDRPGGVMAAAMGAEIRPFNRTFKTVEIRDSDGEVLGLRHWQAAA